MLDVCTLASDPASDCDGNGILDVCESSVFAPEHWMVEQFTSGVDLAGLGVRLVPTGNAGAPLWQLCTMSYLGVWIAPDGHATLQLGDDDFVQLPLPFTFEFAGQLWSDVYVGSNGYVTFGSGDDTYLESLSGHFDRPRISTLFDDLDPSEGGQVVAGQGPSGSFVVTWWAVPEYGLPNTSNTVQLALHPDGAIEMSWPLLTATTGVAGPSNGLGVPAGFVATDLSDAWDCVAHAVDGGDCNENGTPDACEAAPVGDPFWGVEHFVGDFDLGDQLVRWSPNGNSVPPFYQVCSESISEFPIDPLGGTVAMLGDDDSLSWPLGFAFPFAGGTVDEAFIGSNGYLTFGTADATADDTLWSFFSLPRIAGYMADLRPDLGGQVLVSTGPAGSFVVTYVGVPLHDAPSANVNMQILLHPDGAVEIAWLGTGIPTSGVIGISDSTTLPYGFAQTDLSAAGSNCELHQPWDDCNGNGILDGIEIALGCEYDSDMDGIPDACSPVGFGPPAVPCPEDVTRDGLVNVHDLLRVLQAWGDVKPSGPTERCDLVPGKGDRQVDLADLLEVIYGMQQGCDQQ